MAKTGLHEHVNAALTENLRLKTEKENILIQTNHHANMSRIKNEQEARKNKEEAESWERTAKIAKQEAMFYKDLLSKPMHVIAANNDDFKKTYEIQQELLADWIISQKAFKDLALDFGLELGKDKETILKEASISKSKVLTNKSNHNNNIENDEFLMFYKDKKQKKM